MTQPPTLPRRGVIDECFDGLDAEGAERVAALLGEEGELGFVVKITVELVKALNALNIDLLDFSKCGQYLFMLTNQAVSRLDVEGEQVDTIGLQIMPAQKLAMTTLETIIGKAKIEKQRREKLPDRQIASEAAQILKDPPRGPGDDQAPDAPDPACAG